MARRRRIAIVTGSRADYGLLRTLMIAVRNHSKLKLQVIATGMHLIRRFGHTVDEIERDGFRIDARVPMQSGKDYALAQADALARGVAGIGAALARLRSDIVVVLGDRVEALAGALAASATERFCAHLHGGDVAPGHLDDAFRHAITKLAHVHFVASADAGRRVLRLGERSASVHVVGAPGLDELQTSPKPPADWLHHTFGFAPDAPVALVVQHPIGRPAPIEQRTMTHILEALQAAGLSGLMIFPNSDPGHSGIIRAIRQRKAAGQRWRSVKSLPRTDFLSCLQSARLMVGNSSAGIIEAPFVATPSVNVGLRQQGRLRGGSSVVDCTESTRAIRIAIRRALAIPRRRRPRNVYGSGQTGTAIAKFLAQMPMSDNFKRKRIRY